MRSRPSSTTTTEQPAGSPHIRSTPPRRSPRGSSSLRLFRSIFLPIILPLAAPALLLGLGGCPSSDKSGGGAARSCPPDCDQPKIPPGVPPFQVVKDVATGPADGQDVTIAVVLKQPTKRDQIYPALHFLYRYAMTRNPTEPRNFVGEFYTSESDAAAGARQVAKVFREQTDKGPRCENSIKLELPEQVEAAFAHSLNRGEVEDLEDTCRLNEKKKVARFDDKFSHKPTFKVDPGARSVEVQYPYLETGKDEYVKTLSFNAAMTYFAEFMSTMFQKAPDLQQLTYVGLLDDQPALKITVTRQEYDSKLTTVQETIASFAAITFAKIGLHKLSDKAAQKEQEAHKSKTYTNALSFLPKDHVFVSPKLKKSS
jgi:hypothetical protein